MTTTEVPLEIAYTVRQNTSSRTHVERGSEYIGSFSISQTTPVGSVGTWMMNPAKLAGSRIKTLASSYQKFRFRKLTLKVQSSTTTAINGLYLVGYNSNPDAEVSPTLSVPQVFALPGAISANVWRSVVCTARLEDKNRWYNIDADSKEIMNTTQGAFYICVQSPTNSATPIVMPVLLDYEIEFRGNAVNTNNNREPFIWPAGTWSYNSVTGNYTFAPSSGEPVGPVIPNGAAFIVNPEYTVYVDGEEAHIGVIRGTTASWIFYTDIEALQDNTPLEFTGTFTTPRTTGQIIGPN